MAEDRNRDELDSNAPVEEEIKNYSEEEEFEEAEDLDEASEEEEATE